MKGIMLNHTHIKKNLSHMDTLPLLGMVKNCTEENISNKLEKFYGMKSRIGDEYFMKGVLIRTIHYDEPPEYSYVLHPYYKIMQECKMTLEKDFKLKQLTR